MGYRSEIRAIIYPAGGEHNLLNYDKLKLLMNTTFKETWDDWGGLAVHTDGWEWNDHHRALVFTYHDVKWYDSFPEVHRFREFLAQVRDLEYEYEFIRLGEDTEDVESDSTGDSQGFMYVNRSIEVAF